MFVFRLLFIYLFIYFIIVASQKPGWVKIILKRDGGKDLGETKILYYDEDKEALQRIIQNPRLQEDFFREYAESLANRNTATASGGEPQNAGSCGE